MRQRHDTLITIYAFVITGLLAVFVVLSFQDRGEGLRLKPADLSQRVSQRYVYKNVKKANDKPAVYGDEKREEGSANVVTSIVVNYRAFDTLGEVIVLFAATAGVGLLLSRRKKVPANKYTPSSDIVQSSIPVINILIFATGLSIMVFGHLTPGGGFPGGAVVASGAIITALAFRRSFNPRLYLVMESFAGLSILAVGILGLFLSPEKAFLANFLPTGKIGAVFSAGTVMILYILIGVKVASEIANISYYYLAEADEEEKA